MLFRLPFIFALALVSEGCMIHEKPKRTFSHPIYVFDQESCTFRYRGDEQVIPCKQAKNMNAISDDALSELLEVYLFN